MNVRLLFILIFTFMGNVSNAQERVLMVRLSSESNTINVEKLNDLFKNQDPLFVGLLENGAGLIVLKTEMKMLDIENFVGYKIKTFPTRINYNVICNIVKNGQPLPATFVQYNTVITKFNVQQVPQLQYAHYNYLKQLKNIGSVLFEGNFDSDDGGFLLIDGSIEADVINADPTIRSGFIIPEKQRASLSSINCN